MRSLTLALLPLLACSRPVAVAPQDMDRPQPTPAPEAARPKSAPVIAAERLRETATLDEALRLTVPLMKEADVDQHSAGTALLALWSQQRLTWSQVQVARNETTLGRTLKDPDPSLGKRLCAVGAVAQINRDKTSPNGQLWHGILVTHENGELPLSFYAAGSSGDLEQSSRARICGVVTGVHTYSTIESGVMHAVQLVGMFDLPENREAQP